MVRMVITILAASAIMTHAAPSGAMAQKAIQVGDTMPGFFLKDMEGKDFFLNDHVGPKAKTKHRAMIFSLSASYCKPCRKEIPELDEMSGKYRGKGLGIYLIAVERKEQAEKLVRETKTSIPVLIDRYLVVPKLIGREGIPCTLLVDGDGIVRFINTGFNEDNADEFIRRFEDAVAAVLDDSGDSSGE